MSLECLSIIILTIIAIEYYLKNREHALETIKKYNLENKERLVERKKEYNRKYYQKNRNEKVMWQRKYYKTHMEQEKQRKDRYRKTENGMKVAKRGYKKYYQTEKGKQTFHRSICKYKNSKKWIPVLPNIFPREISVDYHHIDGKIFVVPLPRNLHKKTGGYSNHVDLANEWIEFYYNINPITFLQEKHE